MRRALLLGLTLLLATLSAGCAFGHKVAYTSPTPLFTVVGSGTERLGLAVHDQRRQVVPDGNPEFVGESRSLYHIPYGVHTASGKPLAEDLTAVLSAALTAKGFIPMPVSTTPRERPEDVVRKLSRQSVPRNLLLTLFEWRTDTYFKTQLFYDLDLRVLDGQGVVLAQDRSTGHEQELTVHPAITFANRVEALANGREISAALSGRTTVATPSTLPAQGQPVGSGPSPPATSWRVFSYAPGMTDRTSLAELAPSIESCRLLRNALEPHHPRRILACETVQP